ncbi:transmembrane protein 267 isoform X2 [Aotus nancymaae]|uniref:transmembrane protein 267 isoform X2 n=1 Tax=Aotus nancymaae TaxID=37293 RepID=UPI0030FF3A5A
MKLQSACRQWLWASERLTGAERCFQVHWLTYRPYLTEGGEYCCLHCCCCCSGSVAALVSHWRVNPIVNCACKGSRLCASYENLMPDDLSLSPTIQRRDCLDAGKQGCWKCKEE